ncbi:MAG TPA: superoxide dismutase family protein [Burkholderiales bacterium]
MRRVALPLLALALAGCQSAMQQGSEEPVRATAQLKPTQGNKTVGEATFEDMGEGRTRLVVIVHRLKPNSEHGFHIHEAGDCSAPDATSAKGHFNPSGKPHGNRMAGDHHAGDLPALKTDAKGVAKLETVLAGLSVSGIVGRGLIVHADPDDYRTQPTGNSGARVACGVIQLG